MYNNRVLKLKKLSQHSSILYIDNDLPSQNQFGLFAINIFQNFYKSYNGYEGLKIYNIKRPDIVMVSIDVQKIEIIDFIMKIKSIDSKANILVVSKRDHKDLDLLKSIDLGVGFVYKPLNLGVVSSVLYDILKDIKKESTDHNDIFNDLKQIVQKNDKFEFINSYKGITIHNNGMVVNMIKNEMVVNVPKTQIIAMGYERSTIINIQHNNKYITAKVLNLDFKKEIVVLVNPEYIDFKIDQYKSSVMMKVDKSFQASLHFHHNNIDVIPIDISSKSISLYTANSSTILKVGSSIDLTFIFMINSTTTLVNEKKVVKGFAKGKITQIEPYRNGKKIVASYQIQKADERTLNKYLKELEINIIQEFKKLLIKGI